MGRAQIFELLREPTEETVAQAPEPLRPTYLEDNVADVMMSRAFSSFRAPPCAKDLVDPENLRIGEISGSQGLKRLALRAS